MLSFTGQARFGSEHTPRCRVLYRITLRAALCLCHGLTVFACFELTCALVPTDSCRQRISERSSLTVLLVQFLFSCAPLRSKVGFVQKWKGGAYAAMLVKMTEHALMTIFVITVAATSTQYAPPGWMWHVARSRMVTLMLLNVIRILLAVAMDVCTHKVKGVRVMPHPDSSPVKQASHPSLNAS